MNDVIIGNACSLCAMVTDSISSTRKKHDQILGLVFNNRGLLGWLPIVANFEYSVAVFKFKDNERGLKLSFLINMVMYCAFSVVIQNYVGAAANLFTAIMTAISLIRGKKPAAEEPEAAEGPEAAEDNSEEA